MNAKNNKREYANKMINKKKEKKKKKLVDILFGDLYKWIFFSSLSVVHFYDSIPLCVANVLFQTENGTRYTIRIVAHRKCLVLVQIHFNRKTKRQNF